MNNVLELSRMPEVKGDTPDLMPQAIAAEEQILGALMWDENAYGRIDFELKPEHFYLAAHRRIYGAVVSLANAQQPIDMMTVAQWLADNKLLKDVGGKAVIARLLDLSVSAANIDKYAGLVIEKAKRRALISYGSAASRLGYDTSKKLADVMDEAESSLFEITQDTGQGGPEHVGESMTRIHESIMAYDENAAPGSPSGFYDLDAMTQGFQRSDFIIAAARPAMGKSSLADQIAHHSAAQSQKPSVVFSLEMSKDQLAFRALSRETGIETGRLKTRRIAHHEWPMIAEAEARIAARPVFTDDTPGVSVSYIRSKCRQIMARHGQLGMVTIDYLQLMGGDTDNRVQELSKITRSLKNLARELDVPVIALSQLSRGVESRTNKRPIMSDLRDSGAIEQDADLIMMLYREEYYDPETADRGVAEVILQKHRNGPTGTVKLLFQPEFTKFLNRASEEPPQKYQPKTTMHREAI